jgi:hypothetical protein
MYDAEPDDILCTFHRKIADRLIRAPRPEDPLFAAPPSTAGRDGHRQGEVQPAARGHPVRMGPVSVALARAEGMWIARVEGSQAVGTDVAGLAAAAWAILSYAMGLQERPPDVCRTCGGAAPSKTRGECANCRSYRSRTGQSRADWLQRRAAAS